MMYGYIPIIPVSFFIFNNPKDPQILIFFIAVIWIGQLQGSLDLYFLSSDLHLTFACLHLYDKSTYLLIEKFIRSNISDTFSGMGSNVLLMYYVH
jgi:hypothetical protein